MGKPAVANVTFKINTKVVLRDSCMRQADFRHANETVLYCCCYGDGCNGRMRKMRPDG